MWLIEITNTTDNIKEIITILLNNLIKTFNSIVDKYIIANNNIKYKVIEIIFIKNLQLFIVKY